VREALKNAPAVICKDRGIENHHHHPLETLSPKAMPFKNYLKE
jgi:hypothetical protein